MSSLRDTYYDYLGHIALVVLLDKAKLGSSDMVPLSSVADTLKDIAADTHGNALIPTGDIVTALDKLVEKGTLAPLKHPAHGPAYHISAQTHAFFESEHATEGSTIWKCKTLPGYMQLVLQAMHEKKQAGFDTH